MSRNALMLWLLTSTSGLLLSLGGCNSCESKSGPNVSSKVPSATSCSEGYALKDGKCVDIDECGGVATPCGPHPDAKCTNTAGAYECTCPEGFSGGGPGGFGCFPAAVGLMDENSTVCAIRPIGKAECWNPHGGKPEPTKVPQLEALGPLVTVAARPSGGNCALTRDGSVHCWGDNREWQFGQESPEHSDTPVRVPGITDAVALVAETKIACVIRRQGSVACWGRNNNGSLGRDVPKWAPVGAVTGLDGVVALTQHLSTSCALKRDGTAWCWGSRPLLVKGGPKGSSTPVQLPGVSHAIQVEIAEHGCFLRADRSVWCWGENSFGQLGTGDQEYSATARRATIEHVTWLGLRSHGTCVVSDGQMYWFGRDYLNHDDEGNSEAYEATEHESTLVPTAVKGAYGVRSFSDDRSLVMLENGRIGVVTDALSYIVTRPP